MLKFRKYWKIVTGLIIWPLNGILKIIIGLLVVALLIPLALYFTLKAINNFTNIETNIRYGLSTIANAVNKKSQIQDTETVS